MLITCAVSAYVQRQLGEEEEVNDASKNGTICRSRLQAYAFFPLVAGKGKQKKSIKQIRGKKSSPLMAYCAKKRLLTTLLSVLICMK